ncbi:Uncharacterised protein [Mycobacterium tuberculosis]|nr:Uncharacterised protein [Mycobacterium tuberculosis]
MSRLTSASMSAATAAAAAWASRLLADPDGTGTKSASNRSTKDRTVAGCSLSTDSM